MSIRDEITRLETAKSDIETAIETCGVNVPDTELISTYASYIRQIPSAIYSGLNASEVGGVDEFIQSIKQTNGVIEATAGGLVSASASGLAPKIGTAAAATIATQADEWVLTSTKGALPTWRKLPSNAFSNSNTVPAAHCTTAAGTAAKTATYTYYTATANRYVYVTFRYANSSAGAITLNINSTGAKPIYINGSASSASNYTLPAGAYLAYYDGSNYHVRTDGILPGEIQKANSSAKVANDLVVKIKSGSTEGTDLYTFNGPAAKTLDIKQGTGIGLTTAAGAVTISNSGVRSVTTGDNNGTIKVNTNGTSTNVSVKGLGSAAYTAATDYAVRKTLTNEDLNSITTPGFYNAGGGNTVTNKPEGVEHFGLEVIHGASGSYYVQILFEESYSNVVWRRHCQSGTWSSWTKDVYTDTHYTTHLYVGAKSSSNNNASNASTTNGNTYLKLFDDSTLRHQYNIKGTGNTSVTSDASGNIVINSPTTLAWGSITGKPDMTDYVTVAGNQTVTGIKTFTNKLKIQDGDASGSFVLGADVNAKTLTANVRKLGRMGVPSYDSTTKTVAGISFDSQANANYADFGGHPNNASSIAPDVIRFVVANTHDNTVNGARTLALQISKQNGLVDTSGGGTSVASAKFFIPVEMTSTIHAEDTITSDKGFVGDLEGNASSATNAANLGGKAPSYYASADSLNKYLPLAGGSMNNNASLQFCMYGNRYLTINGNSIAADMSNCTGGWAGAFASVKHKDSNSTAADGTTVTTMLGWCGGAENLKHIFMGGTYSNPAMKMTPAGIFTFKNTIVGSITGEAGSVAWGNVTGKPTTFTPSAHNHDDLYYRKADVYTKTETNTELAKKLDKITYEFNKELALGSDGKVCIGIFPMYDSNITVDINSTTSTTYHGTLVIATQNINTTGGGTYTATVYGDAYNTLTDSIKIKYVSGSKNFEVYINLPGWSKNAIHVKCVSLAGAPTNVVEKVSAIPSDATIVPTNALTNKFVLKTSQNDHTHATSVINALTGYSKATTAANLATTDTLNSALGKLEYKAHYAYDWVIGVTVTDADEYINKWSEIVGFIDSVKEGTDILDEFVTRKTAQVITGSKNFNTNTNAAPLRISRTGGTVEAVSIGVNDSQAIFEYVNDEKANSFVFKLVNQDSEGSDGSGANTSTVTFTGNSSGSTLAATTLQGKLAYTYLTGSSATKDQAIVSNGTANGWTLKTLGSNAFNSTAYLPLAGGQMTADAYIAWNNGAAGNDLADWSITANGLRIISSIVTTSNAPTQYSTALHVKGRYGFQLASQGGDTANAFYIRNVHNSTWNTLLHSGNTHIKSGVITINGSTITPLTAHQSLENYVHKTVGGVQSILGGLVIGASSDASAQAGRIMLTGSTNPLIGIRATGGTAFYFQSTGDTMYLGPTSSRAMSFIGSTGAASFPNTVTASGFIKSGSNDNYVLLGAGGHKAISDFLLKTELPSEELKSNVTTITKELTVTQDWMDTGIAGTNIPANGTYIVQVSVAANDGTNGNMWNCLWSGVMSWHKDGTNDTDSDEILLHRSGHAYGNTLYLRTVMRSSSTLKLQIAANTNIGKAYTYTFKFKQIL